MFKNVGSGRTPHRRVFLKLVGVAGVTSGIVPFLGTAFAAEQHNHTSRRCLRSCRKPTQKRKNVAHRGGVARSVGWTHILGAQPLDRNLQPNDAAMKAAEGQAVSNAKSIAATIEPFYGVAAKEAFFKLLAGHYGAVKAYLVASASGDASAQANATQSLTSNAEEMLSF